MAMKRCPVCGEKYSDTYRRCPFCEEEDALREGHRSNLKSGHRAAQGGPGFLSPVLIIVIILLALLLLYLLFGDALKNRKPKPDDSAASSPAASSVVKPSIPGSSTPAVSAPAVSTPAVSTPTVPEPVPEPEPTVDLSTLPKTLTLNKTDFTIPVGDAPVKLRASGGKGVYTWSSSDDGIASVDEEGNVVAISRGTAIITVTDGQGKGECIVRVKAGSGVPNTGSTQQPASGDTGSGGTHKLNREDFTRSTSEGPFQLKVSGITTGISWASSNTSVAVVDQNGNVQPVGPGKANITASWDGQTLTCVIRVPN